MTEKVNLLIDFDSTFIKTEGLEELASIVLDRHPDKQQLCEEIIAITNAGMDGSIDFGESLKRRLEVLKPDEASVKQVGEVLREMITESLIANKQFILSDICDIYIISGGFKEFIVPVVGTFGIPADHVFANTFDFTGGRYSGYDRTNPLANAKGKVNVVSCLNLTGKTFVLGDGYTDYEIKLHQPDFTFIAFTENVKRQKVIEVADYIAKDFSEVIEIIKKK